MTIQLHTHIQRDTGFQLDVQASLSDREVTAIYGPSGSGKTTLLKLLAGIAQVSRKDTVQISFRGINWHLQDGRARSLGRHRQAFVPPHRRNIGYVIQDLQLFPHLSVAGNLQYAARRRRPGSQDVKESQLLELLKIQHLVAEPVERLSGGEKQRVAIARALFTGPQLLLLDEPLGSLDPPAKAGILAYLKQLQAELQLPMVFVSHAREEVAYLADQVLIIQAGRVAQPMSKEDFANDLNQANETETSSQAMASISA